MENNKFEVRVINEEKGKGLFAVAPIREGEVIFEEKPLVCCQFTYNAEYKYLACDYCLRPLETAEENARRLSTKQDLVLPFPECCGTDKESIVHCEACGTGYCSAECRNEAWHRYHQSLCLQTRQNPDARHPLVLLKETWKQMHYPPETTSVMLLARMVAMVNQANDKAQILSTFSQFCHRTMNDTLEIAHNLLGAKFVGQIDLLRQTLQSAVNTELVPEWFTPDGFRKLLALVGTNGQGIGTSALSRWAKNVSALDLPNEQKIEADKLIDKVYDDVLEVVGEFVNVEGSGLYELQSKINHSCVPNAAAEFPHSNSTLVIKATRDIRPGEEIRTSYLDECDLYSSRHSRQKALSSQYLFICNCEKCQEQAYDPDVSSEEEIDQDSN